MDVWLFCLCYDVFCLINLGAARHSQNKFLLHFLGYWVTGDESHLV